MSRRVALRALIAATAVAALAYGLLGRSSLPALRPAPALPSALERGPRVTLAALRGHAVAVVFWASWCDGCHAEAAAVERFARSTAGRGRVIGIDFSDGGSWRDFLHRYGWSFPVFADPDGYALEAYGVSVGLPATVVVDSRGRIARTAYGVQTVARLRSEVAAAD